MNHVTLCHVRHVTLRHITHCVGSSICVSVSDCSRDCRTSGVSSGATSGSGGSNPSYWHHPGPGHQDQRKFTTLNRNQQKTKNNPILRTRSFQISQQQHNKLSPFSPSENSAFHCISANNNKDLSQVSLAPPHVPPNPVTQFQASKFVTSTPVKSGPGSQSSRRRAGHMRQNVFPPPPPVTSVSSVYSVTSVMSPLSSLSTLATGNNNIITFGF